MIGMLSQSRILFPATSLGLKTVYLAECIDAPPNRQSPFDSNLLLFSCVRSILVVVKHPYSCNVLNKRFPNPEFDEFAAMMTSKFAKVGVQNP
jgi:hypothetical protein